MEDSKTFFKYLEEVSVRFQIISLIFPKLIIFQSNRSVISNALTYENFRHFLQFFKSFCIFHHGLFGNSYESNFDC